MVLFLDFDGVLHPLVRKSDDVPFESLPHLWAILRACPHVEVVFSTSWREKRSLEELIEIVTAGGGEDLALRFIGTTPVMHAIHEGDNARHRERECLAWLAANETRWPVGQRPIPWLALDDMAYWFSIPCWNLYLVDHRIGITETDVISVIRRLEMKE